MKTFLVLIVLFIVARCRLPDGPPGMGKMVWQGNASVWDKALASVVMPVIPVTLSDLGVVKVAEYHLGKGNSVVLVADPITGQWHKM